MTLRQILLQGLGISSVLLIGGSGGWFLHEVRSAQARAEAEQAAHARYETLSKELDALRVRDELSTTRVEVAERRTSAASASVAAERAEVERLRARVRWLVAPEVRARRVAVAVQTTTTSVVPLAYAGRDGFWVHTPTFVKIEEDLVAAQALVRVSTALEENVAAEHERAEAYKVKLDLANERVVWLQSAYDAEREAAAARVPPLNDHSWWVHTESWVATGVATAIVVVAVVTPLAK